MVECLLPPFSYLPSALSSHHLSTYPTHLRTHAHCVHLLHTYPQSNRSRSNSKTNVSGAGGLTPGSHRYLLIFTYPPTYSSLPTHLYPTTHLPIFPYPSSLPNFTQPSTHLSTHQQTHLPILLHIPTSFFAPTFSHTLMNPSTLQQRSLSKQRRLSKQRPFLSRLPTQLDGSQRR